MNEANPEKDLNIIYEWEKYLENKIKQDARYMKKNQQRRNEALSIGFLDISVVDEETFERFMYNYRFSFNNLCVNPKTGKQTQSIFEFISEKYNIAKIANSSDKIIYLYKSNDNQDNYEIVAFAIISNPDRFTTIIELLCSSIDKTIRRNGKPLGISLLDDIYSDYVVKQQNILLIQPATPELVPYYIKWKTPSLPIDWYNQKKTNGYLIYSTDIKRASDQQLEKLIRDVIVFNNLCRELHIIPSEVLSIPKKEDRKNLLTSKINEINDSRRDQLLDRLSYIDYFSVDEIRTALIHMGGTKSRRRTKRVLRKTKCNRKTKYI